MGNVHITVIYVLREREKERETLVQEMMWCWNRKCK